MNLNATPSRPTLRRMGVGAHVRLTAASRRRGLWLAHVNAALWSAGVSLTSGSLIVYFALDLEATGVKLGLIFALPAIVGVLRLVAPWAIQWLGSKRRACLAFSAVSYLVLALLPGVALVGTSDPPTALALMIGLLCGHQLLEYIGNVAFWSWMADLVPRRLRGRYFARRQIIQLAVAIPTLLAGGAFADHWREAHAETLLWGYAIPNGLGAALLIASLVPLWMMPDTGAGQLARLGITWDTLRAPFRDWRFGRLVLFGCWLAAANGLTGAAQGAYPKQVLGLGLVALQWMRITMRGGQMGVAGWAGRFSDRYGNQPMMILCQTVVATSMCFFLLATPEHAYWLFGAYVAWSFYAGLNIGLPNLMLRLAPDGQQQDNSGYIALYFAASGACYAASSVLGGWLFDVLTTDGTYSIGAFDVTHYQIMFALGLVARSLAVVWLVLLIEPGAQTLAEIVRGRHDEHA